MIVNSNLTTNFTKKLGITLTAGALLFSASAVNSNTIQKLRQQDTFEYCEKTSVPPAWTNNINILKHAPSPKVKVEGKMRNAVIVVDISKNVLYHYDEKGDAQMAYSVATGKKDTPTHIGVRIVSHVETYPYKTAPRSTKRRRNPRPYGPKAIILDKLNPETGERSSYGEFIHGNNDASSIGKYKSQGCIRMDNEVIKELSKHVKRGDIVLVKD